MSGRELERELLAARVSGRLFGPGPGTVTLGRFELVRQLGSGGMGVVYEARDVEGQRGLALKALHAVDGRSLFRLKREFRALSELSHPGLVRLEELFSDGAHWFFTMELVDGVPFNAFVRRHDGCDGARLRAAFGQLVEAVAALHRASKLHCDLKPSNVLVERSGRVVVLDFGLVRELPPEGSEATAVSGLVGTPAYLAPEQAAGGEATEASDLYALGVMLYEALLGRLPFDGNPFRVLRDKQALDAPAPTALYATDAALGQLCSALLARDPAARPDVAAILAELHGRPVAGATLPPLRDIFVGRRHELAVLQDARRRAALGQLSCVLVSGLSGMGKSALLDELCRDLSGTLLLRGRCNEQESLPYKALDGIVDGLYQYLDGLPDERRAALLPRHFAHLAQLFPVLGQLPADTAVVHGARAIEPREQRNLAFGALKELLLRVRDQQPVAFVIDDLQWGDLDSLRLLAHLLGPPEAPALLVVAAFRAEDVASSEILVELCSPRASTLFATEIDRIELSALQQEEAVELVRELSSDTLTTSADEAYAALATESRGVPFFITELVYHKLDHVRGARPSEATATLEQVLQSRVQRLPLDAQHLLQVLSIAGGPLEQGIAIDAAGLAHGDRAALLTLRAARLIRTRGTRDADAAETYHDRVRETVVAGLSGDRIRALHARVAAALQRHDVHDPERLVVHYAGARDDVRAGETAIEAADAAVEKLAFNRAAELYTRGLGHVSDDGARRRMLHEKLGDALVNAGRGAQAAEAYLRAAHGISGAAARRLHRMAAQQYLRSGRMDEGIALTKDLLSGVGVAWPESTPAVLASLAWTKTAVAVRRALPAIGSGSSTAEAELERLDALAAVFREISAFDMLRGAALQSRYFLDALRVGEPNRLLLGLAWEAFNGALLSSSGGHAATRKLLSRASELARELGTPYATATALFAHAGCEFFHGNYAVALPLATEARSLFRQSCPGTHWEQSVLTTIRLGTLEQTGNLRELLDETPDLLRQSRERDDQFLLGFLALAVPAYHLMRDEPDAASELLAELPWRSRSPAFTMIDLMVTHRRTDVYLYTGRCDLAFEHHMAAWGRFRASLLFHAVPLRVLGLWYLCRAALGAARAEPRLASQALAVAREHARTLERLPRADAAAWALMVRAGIAYNERARTRVVVELLERSIAACHAAQMPLFALYCRRNLELIRPQLPGGASHEGVDAFVRAQGVLDPTRWVATYAPGFVTLPLRRPV